MVEQVGFYDLYRWNSRLELVLFRSVTRLDAVLREIKAHEVKGSQVFVRQNLAGRVQWSQYSVFSSSHLGYCWDQEMDRFVVEVRGSLTVNVPVQLPLPLDFGEVSHG